MRYKIVSFMASDLQVVPITAAVAFLILVVMIIGLCTCLKGSDDNRNKKVKRRNKKEQEAGRKQVKYFLILLGHCFYNTCFTNLS